MKKLILLVSLLLSPIIGQPVDMITWKENADIIKMDKYTIQQIFTKKLTKWPNGHPIIVFTKPMNSIEHRDFVLTKLGYFPTYYQQLLDREVCIRRATPVIEVEDDKQMIMKIEQTPGSIGYINYDIFIGTKKVILID
jgi:ABC-type phosphate transport system substrate-binding protein